MKTIYQVTRELSDFEEVSEQMYEAAAGKHAAERRTRHVAQEGTLTRKKIYEVRKKHVVADFQLEAFGIASDEVLSKLTKIKKVADAESILREAIFEYMYSIADAYSVNRSSVGFSRNIGGEISMWFNVGTQYIYLKAQQVDIDSDHTLKFVKQIAKRAA